MRPIIALAILALAGVGIYYVIEDANDGPLENAAEEIDDAADEIEDDLN